MRMCALLVGLPDVVVVGVGDWPSWLRVVVAIDGERPTCSCGGVVHRHGVREVLLVDLPVFGRPTRLVWRKQRWRCTTCGHCWCDENPEVGTTRCSLTTRAVGWATLQVGRHGRAVADVARDLCGGWHPVMDAVVAVGEQLIDHPDRIGRVNALGLDGPCSLPNHSDPTSHRRAPMGQPHPAPQQPHHHDSQFPTPKRGTSLHRSFSPDNAQRGSERTSRRRTFTAARAERAPCL